MCHISGRPQFLPNVHYAGSGEDGARLMRVVGLEAVRDIGEGEELLSSYFTLV